MTEQEYIEGLTDIIFEYCSGSETFASSMDIAQAITNWHREQGLRVVPYEPTKRMKESVEPALDAAYDNNKVDPEYGAVGAFIYQAMIDAAKGDGES